MTHRHTLKNQDGTTMAYRWPAGTTFKRIDLDVQDRSCPVCGRDMHVCDHRYHHLWTLQGPTQVVNRLVRCPDASCESRGCTFSPEAELSISMPRWCLGCVLLARPSPLCPPLVGIPASCSITGHAPDPVV